MPERTTIGGFLTGKYRSLADTEGRYRGEGVKKYLTSDGLRVLDVLDGVAAAHGTEPATVALAWASANDTITAPLAAATSTAQLDQLFAATTLELSAAQVTALNEASTSFR